MEEKILVKGKFTRFNILSLLFVIAAIYCLYFLYNDYSGNYGYCGLANNFLDYFIKGWFFYQMGWFIVFCATFILSIVCYFWLNCCEIIVTDKRIHGKMNFGLRVDLPFDKISSVSSGALGSLVVATSSNKIYFWMMKNRDEVHQIIKDVLIQRQPTETVIKQEISQSNADELKKFKDLLDSGIITQEEFDGKKKQLLGL